jgi:pyruvate/2-oxoglutarate dehydrogenase complex dihydrolipoamide dehydrogenase (E3) component
MVEARRIVRVDILSAVHRTTDGIRIGMTEKEVRKRYPNVRTEEHQYDPAGHYLVLESKDRRYGIVFETDGERVTNFRIGELGPVGYVEGCR